MAKQGNIEQWMYDILQIPLVTEKTSQAGAFNQYGFIVRKDATKPQIKQAVEAIFKVDVTRVNTLISKGKTKRFRGKIGQRSDRKKAFVHVKDGQTIDVTVGK